jgi:hypothetical protein
MFELLVLTALVVGLLIVGALFFRLILKILFFPFTVLFWVLGGIFQLLLLPFKILGGLVVLLVFLPLALVGLPLLLGLGIPLLIGLIGLVGFWLIGSLICVAGGFFCGL